MIISFVDVFGSCREISFEEVNYIISYSGKLVIKDVEPNTCVLNHKTFQHESIFELPVKQDDITLSCGINTVRIKTLKGEISQESIIDYLDISKQFSTFAHNGSADYTDIQKAFDIDGDNPIRLCSFNKKFAHLLQSSNRDEILKDVKYLPHIFYRPKLHLKQVEEIRPASIVTRIGSESIRHLASHSEHWKGIKANGLIPERLLARILEDNYAIYENIAAKTIVDRLYALEKKEKEDTIDCKMNFNLSESYSQGGERQNFFDAINFLFKGFENSESSTTQKLIEETLEVINSILDYLSKCKSTNLYRHIKKEKEIKGSLKKTNIFMMDNYYKKVYQLWELLGKHEEISQILEIKELKDEYLLYVELIILFCLNYMGFKPENESETILSEKLFNHCCFKFQDWKITLNAEKAKLFDGFITAEIIWIKHIQVHFNIELPESSVYQKFNAKKSGNYVVFEHKIEGSQIDELCSQLLKLVDKKQQNQWKNAFRQTLTDEMKKVSIKRETVLFIPWKYGIADDYKTAKETINQIKTLIPSGFDEYYILNITRPNELRNINDEELLKSLVSYSLRNQESTKCKEVGVIPVTLNDINSFRRFSKIFLKNMILLKDEQNCCPQCGSKLKGDKSQGYHCTNQNCRFEIYNSQCPDCKKKYWYTNYPFPKVFQLDTESVGMKILLDENDLGFKNITTLSSEHKPECPYCNKGNSITFTEKYSLKDYIIFTNKEERIQNKPVIQSTTITKPDTPKKPLVSGSVNFIKPSVQNISTIKESTDHQKSLCPYCNKYDKKKDESLILHIYNNHERKAKKDGLIRILGPMIRCANCKELISECSDQETIKHLNKKCIFKQKPASVVIAKKTTTKRTAVLNGTKLAKDDLGICRTCSNCKDGKCIRGRPLGHGTSMCAYYNK